MDQILTKYKGEDNFKSQNFVFQYMKLSNKTTFVGKQIDTGLVAAAI